jgi:hypothetical protein
MSIKINATSFVITTIILFIINLYLLFNLNKGFDLFDKITTLEKQVNNLNEMLINADIMQDYIQLYLNNRESMYFELYHQSAKRVYEFHTNTIENSTLPKADSLLHKVMDSYLILYNQELEKIFGAGGSMSIKHAYEYLNNDTERILLKIELNENVKIVKDMFIGEIEKDKHIMQTTRDFYYQTYIWITGFNLLFFIIFTINVYHIFLLAYKKNKL